MLERVHQAFQGVLVTIFYSPQAEKLQELLVGFACLPCSFNVFYTNFLPW
jgi:hypothetical protein